MKNLFKEASPASALPSSFSTLSTMTRCSWRIDGAPTCVLSSYLFLEALQDTDTGDVLQTLLQLLHLDYKVLYLQFMVSI